MQTLTIGTRSSPLAMWQTNWVKTQLEGRGHRVLLREISTSGDRIQKGPLSAHGGKGLFVKELEAALLSGEVHLAVHSLKDVPTVLSEEFTLAAFLPRADPRDCFICNQFEKLKELTPGSRVGSSSPRRISQLLAINPGVQTENLRGNVGTRLARIEAGDLTATFLAKAGLDRLEVSQSASIHPLDPGIMLPAAGQGIVAIETLSSSREVIEALSPLDHSVTRASAMTERALVRNLNGSCTSPIGAYSVVEGKSIHLRSFVGDLKGRNTLKEELSGELEKGEDIGQRLADRLNQLGAQEILSSCDVS